MSSAPPSSIPASFTEIRGISPFVDHVGPFYESNRGATVLIGFLPGDHHGNMWGVLQGGVTATLADFALGYSCWKAINGETKLATLNLTVDYLAAGKVGQWVEMRCQAIKLGKSVCFSWGEIFSNDKLIGQARGSFHRISNSRG